MRFGLVSTVALAAVSSSAFAADTPLDVVRSFVAALSSERATAYKMVSPDAQMGVGDMGGPFVPEAFDNLVKDCAFDLGNSSIKPLGMPNRDITLVEATMVCRANNQASHQPVDFMVEGTKISGFYVPMKSGLAADPHSESSN